MVLVALTCALVSNAGVFGVEIDDSAQVRGLKDAIKDKKPDTIKGVADNLQLFLAKTEGGAWLKSKDLLRMRKGEIANEVESRYMKEELEDPEVKICSVFPSIIPDETIHVLVGVPKSESKRPAEDERIGEVLKILRTMESDVAATEPKTFTDFKNLSVREDEFRLDSLSKTRQIDDPIVMTPTLHKFWKGFGEFPPYYFVRMEKVVFWKVIKKLLFGKDRVVIVGSPGVGKSCFLMLIACYLACTKGKKVLVIRRLKQRKRMNTVVFFDGRGSYARLSNLSSQDIKAVRGQAQGAIVLVDGFNQAEVEDPDKNYMPFDFLATSCQFDAKQDDDSRVVVLPACC